MKYKKVISMCLASVMALPVFGCVKKEEEPVDYSEDIIDTAQTFCTDIKALKIDKALKITDGSVADPLTELEPLLVFEEGEIYNSEAALWAEAVSGTIDFTLDEDSVSSSKKKPKGTVDVTFTIADQEAISGSGEYYDIDEMIGALADAESREVTVTIEVAQNDDEDWVVTDYGNLIHDLFSFTELTELDLRMPLDERIYDVWLDGDVYDEATDTFHNTSYIGMCIIFGDDTPYNINNMTYTVYYNDEEVFSANVTDYDEENPDPEKSGGGIFIYVTVLDRGIPTSDAFLLAAGEYTIVVSYEGEEFYRRTCSVEYEADPDTFDLAGHVDVLEIDSDAPAEFSDDIDQERSGWYIGDELVDDSHYASGTGTVTFRLYVGSDHGELGYTMFYYESESCPVPIMDYLITEAYGDSSLTVADDGSMYYEFSVDADSDGYYILGICSGQLNISSYVVFGCCHVG